MGIAPERPLDNFERFYRRTLGDLRGLDRRDIIAGSRSIAMEQEAR